MEPESNPLNPFPLVINTFRPLIENMVPNMSGLLGLLYGLLLSRGWGY